MSGDRPALEAHDWPAVPAGGAFVMRPGRPGLVVGAPHGTSDRGTDEIGTTLAMLTQFGLLVARGWTFPDPRGWRFNVNRPTQGVPRSPSLEFESADARRVYESYREHLRAAAQGALQLYVEVHGNVRAGSAGRIEVATVGIDVEEARWLKSVGERLCDGGVHRADEVPRLEWLVEPVDHIYFRASAAKRAGALGLAARALHIELPRSARTRHRDRYTGCLAEFLAHAATLAGGSRGTPAPGR